MFRVLAPLGVREQAGEVLTESASPAADLAARYDLRLLVIDDERDVREATRLLLASWGCQVVTAGSVEEFNALPQSERARPDLIIADLRLRGGASGITAIQTLRVLYGQDIPGVIITGDTMPVRLKTVSDSGLPVMHKPLRPAKLHVLLSSLAAVSAPPQA